MAKAPPDSPWHSPERLARGIGRFAPFKSCPLPARLRLARAGSVSSHPPGAVLIAHKQPQDKLAEMPAISRQGAAQLIREMVDDGPLQWRYGRVTLLDLPRLRALAGQSVGLP
jgi:hypothetical protein